MSKNCRLCKNLIKNYLDDNRLRYNACCNKQRIQCLSFTRPRVIKANIDAMEPLIAPSWCPDKYDNNQGNMTQENTPLALPSLPKTYKNMTLYEKRNELLKFPKHIDWKDIEIGCVYVIPKILSQKRKVVRVVHKDDYLLRCCEIDEYGNDSKTLTVIYKVDIETTFITKVLKF